MTDTAAVAAFYNLNPAGEHERLLTFSLEYAISLDAISKCIDDIQKKSTSKVLKVLDLGGGTGRYSVELARRGHNVILTDISAAELEHAAAYAKEEGVELESIIELDASRVSESDLFRPRYYDLILCQGPLYHLNEFQERQRLLSNCAAMCKPNGFVLAAFVTKWGHLRDVIQRDPERVFRESGFYDAYLDTGIYDRVPTRTGYHAGVEEIKGLFDSLTGKPEPDSPNLDIRQILACESFLGGRLSEKLSTVSEDVFQKWVEIALKDADKPEMLGASDHLLVVAQAK